MLTIHIIYIDLYIMPFAKGNTLRPTNAVRPKGSKNKNTIIKEHISLQNFTQTNDLFYYIISNHTKDDIDKMLLTRTFDGNPICAILEADLSEFIHYAFGEKRDFKYKQFLKEAIFGRPTIKANINIKDSKELVFKDPERFNSNMEKVIAYNENKEFQAESRNNDNE